MGEIAASHDMVASAVLYTRLANMGLGVLREHANMLTITNKTSLRKDVAELGRSPGHLREGHVVL